MLRGMSNERWREKMRLEEEDPSWYILVIDNVGIDPNQFGLTVLN